jgi:hypothetical protein
MLHHISQLHVLAYLVGAIFGLSFLKRFVQTLLIYTMLFKKLSLKMAA